MTAQMHATKKIHLQIKKLFGFVKLRGNEDICFEICGIPLRII